MSIEFSSELSEIIARAFAGGVETSIERLAVLIGAGAEPRLAAAGRVMGVVRQFRLELAPALDEGEYDSVRVLRAATVDANSMHRINSLISAGESASVEFKSSMLCSVRDWQEQGKIVEFPTLPGEILKTVCAFLNAEGGDLLVGVDDSGKSCAGVDLDLKLKGWNLDKWQLHFHSLVKDRFLEGTEIQSYLRCGIAEYEAHPIFHISVMPRTSRSFVQRQKGGPHEFFMRNGPRTENYDLPAFYHHTMSYYHVNLRNPH